MISAAQDSIEPDSAGPLDGTGVSAVPVLAKPEQPVFCDGSARQMIAKQAKKADAPR
jgi:hypothetical protein